MSKQIVFCAWGKRVNQYQIQFIWLVTTAASCLLCIHVGLLRSNSLWLPWLCVKAVPRRTTVQTAAARNTAHLFVLEEHGRLSLKTRVELCVRVCVISPSENQCRRRTCQGHSTDKSLQYALKWQWRERDRMSHYNVWWEKSLGAYFIYKHRDESLTSCVVAPRHECVRNAVTFNINQR